MLKKNKAINIICIVLAFSVLALALSIGVVGINALRESIENDEYDPLEGYKKISKNPLPIIGGITENLLPYRVRSDRTVESVYLRLQSYGNYDGKDWLAPTPYTELIDGKYPATYIGTKQIEGRKFATPIALEIEPNNTPKVNPHYTATSLLGNPYKEEYDIPIDDVTPNKDSDEYYRMYYYNYDNVSLKPVLSVSAYSNYEKRYREFVYDQYLDVDKTTKAYMLNIIKEQDFDIDDEELATKVSEYVIGLGEYTLGYDTKLDEEENVAIAFIDKYQEGTCKHFATVATLIFRSLGIPARYTVGYMTETLAGEWVQLTNFDAHAWVEVYVDGFGWKNIEVTPSRMDTTVIVKPVDVEKLYDGTPLYPEQKVIGFEVYEEKGYTYEAVIAGERTEPGITESTIESFKIFNEKGEDVTSKFIVDSRPGKLHVYTSIITLESEDFTYIYNGMSPTSQIWGCKATFAEGESLIEGHSIAIIPNSIDKNVGVHPHSFGLQILDPDGNDVTDCYKTKYAFGKVTVIPTEIFFTAGSAEKKYDGTPLIWNELIYDTTLLAPGDYVKEYEVVGEQTLVGISANVVDLSSIVICNEEGEDVTKNYILNSKDGTLKVYKK